MFVRVGKLAEVFTEVEPQQPLRGRAWVSFDWDKEDGSLEVWVGRFHLIWSTLYQVTEEA